MKTTVYDCNLLHLPKIHNKAGNITALENDKNIPFAIKRVFYIYDIPGGVDRGAHCHKQCHQFMVAVSGSFEVLLDDGNTKRVVQLSRPFVGLHVPPGIWSAEINFSSGAVCLVLASEKYDESDYIRDYNDYLKFMKA